MSFEHPTQRTPLHGWQGQTERSNFFDQRGQIYLRQEVLVDRKGERNESCDAHTWCERQTETKIYELAQTDEQNEN